MAISASRHGSLPLSTPSLYSNVTQSAGQSGDWLPLTPSTNPKLSFIFGQQTLQLEELHEDIFKPVELPDLDQLILLNDNLKAAFIKTLAFEHDQADEGLNIVEYAAVLSFMSESPIEIKAKSDYFPDTQEVEIMSPSPFMKPSSTLHRSVTMTIPDIMGVDQFGNNKSFVWWLVKAGFSQSDTSIMRKFVNMVKNNSDIKKLIKVSIDEDGIFQGPEEHTEVTKSLRKSGSWMNHEKFKSLVLPKTSDMMYGPVVVGGHNWLKLKVVRFTHYAEGTLIPGMNMVDVDRLLNMSAANLKAEIISIMEKFGLEKSMIDKACDLKPKLPFNWSAAAMQMSSAVCDTAYFRYVNWYNYKYNNKCKGATTTHTTKVSGESSQAIAPATPLDSGSTERDSKKSKVSQEKETKNISSKEKKKAGGKGKSWAA
ncbi:uncharacterized protein EDB93DRAFT_1246395 [Suillus bovinus]|uniref:uncharacterized protein n=1 Tax=Suillus bovinus TaxID=48563 RepID=UPI001B87E45C|nr:uncharacterized protein EDB93DRAFT_1246395 [Suillus bovinus]KAG2157900.1 hypothetical protein EDB93DRAFT_1246395 [Suillus bovinus]